MDVDDNKKPQPVACKKCGKVAPPAFDGHCTQCGPPTDAEKKKQQAQQPSSPTPNQRQKSTLLSTETEDVTMDTETIQDTECSYCGYSFGVSEELCPRCGTVNEILTAPSGGEEAQASAPVSYQPGGPTGDIGIHTTCLGCDEELEGDHCYSCGYRGIEQDETWSDFVTERDAFLASLSVSIATLAEDDDVIKDIANALVWGDKSVLDIKSAILEARAEAEDAQGFEGDGSEEEGEYEEEDEDEDEVAGDVAPDPSYAAFSNA
jgi:ribosomal protein L37E